MFTSRNVQSILELRRFVAFCGPALAGIIISALTNTQPKHGTRRAFWIVFFAAWFVSALVCLAHSALIIDVPIFPVSIGLFTVAVVPVALVISAAYSRIPAVRNCPSSLIRLHGVWGWSLLALIGLVAVKFLYQLFFFNATGEEAGWRGFVLPRLQAPTSPLIAALILALFWVLWHFFAWQAEGKPVMTLHFWVEMYAGHILFSLLIVWIYYRAKGSILVAGITHAVPVFPKCPRF
jgi:membrane protease YdiL (CAAX protease family)